MRKVISAFAVAAGLGLLATPVQGRTDPSARSGLVVSESTISPGHTLVVAAQGASPGATVKISLRRSSSSALGQEAITLGVTTASRDGAFRVTVTVPSGTVSGLYTLTAVSNDSVLGVLVLHVMAAVDVVTGLPFTSSGIVPGLAAGTGLIAIGGLLLLSVKHRRSIV